MKRNNSIQSLLMLFSVFLAITAFSNLDNSEKDNGLVKGIQIFIEADTNIISASKKEYPIFKVFMENNGKEIVHLVQPGDGSLDAWRTPKVAWSMEVIEWAHSNPNFQNPKHPESFSKIPFGGRMRCGNVNGLKRDDIFTLFPKDKIQLTWTGGPQIPYGVGKYSIKFYYENAPDIKWKGIGYNDPDALEIIQTKTPEIKLESNEVIITVIK